MGLKFTLERDGVGASCVFLSPEKSSLCKTMLDFFILTFPKINMQIWLQRFDDGLIVNQAGTPLKAEDDFVPRQHLYYFRNLVTEPRIPFDEVVLYQDEHLVVADKPHFLPVTPTGKYVQETLLVRLKRKLGLPNLSPLHRIDRDTAGLVLFGVQTKERGAYQQMFHNRKIKKTYEAIAPYRDDLQFPMVYESRMEDSDIYMQMREVAGTPNSKTTISLIERLPASDAGTNLARYRLEPETGKRHQLRVHMNALGVPILNDGIYPTLTPEQHVMTDSDYAKPLQLLAKRLQFVDPIAKTERVFESTMKLSHETLYK